MKTQIKTALFVALGVIIGIGFNNFAISNVPSKIAVVDVNTVIEKSTQVQALKKEQQAKLLEIESWVIKAKADVDKQSTEENKVKLTKKYNAEFAKKQQAIRDEYGKKLQEIDKNISNIISTQAKSQNYDIVIAKNVVLYGGEDITTAITKAVK